MSSHQSRSEVWRTEDLTPEFKQTIIDLCVAAHESTEFEKMFTVYFPSGGRHFLVWEDDFLASHAVVTTRWAQPDGHPELKTAYVDAVSTHPSRQHMGFGTTVMRDLAASIDDYEIACLQTDLRGFYERLGWELWRGPLAGRGEAGRIPTPDQRGVMVLRLPNTPPVDLDAALTIECQPERIWE
jgi:aminoglycoside 2'-N-acetyltransferase I